MKQTELQATEKKILKIKEKIFTAETFQVLTALTEQLRTLSKVTTAIRRIEKKKYSFTIAEYAKVNLNLKPKDISVFYAPRISREEMSLILYRANKDKIAEYTNTRKSQNLEKRQVTYCFHNSFLFEQDSLVLEHQPNPVFIANKKAILIANCYYEVDRSTIPEYTVICDKKYIKEVNEEITFLIEKYSSSKNKFIIVEGNSMRTKNIESDFDLKDVVLHNNVREEIETISNMFENYSEYEKRGTKFKSSICFHGVPGTGKTTAIQALAKSVIDKGGTVIQFLCSNGYSLSKDISSLYMFAKQSAPALVIIEDFDLIAAKRSESNLSTNLLNTLSGNAEVDGVVSVFTTNDISTVDSAAKRAGRIDRIYEIGHPNNSMKIDLLKIHLNKYNIEVNISQAVKASDKIFQKECTGAEIDAMIRGAMNKATAEKRKVEPKDLLWACGGHLKDSSTQTIIGY